MDIHWPKNRKYNYIQHAACLETSNRYLVSLSKFDKNNYALYRLQIRLAVGMLNNKRGRSNLLVSPLAVTVIQEREYQSEQPTYRYGNPHSYPSPQMGENVSTWNTEQPQRKERYNHCRHCVASSTEQPCKRKHGRKQEVKWSADKKITISFSYNSLIGRKARHNTFAQHDKYHLHKE